MLRKQNARWFERIDPVCRMDACHLPEHSRVIRFEYPACLAADQEGDPRPAHPGWEDRGGGT